MAKPDMLKTEAPPWETQRAPGPFAAVEIMGHRVVAGSISDATFAGTAMLQVQHPSMPDHDDKQPLTELFSASAIFSIRPCSREDATRVAEARWRRLTPEPTLAELESTVDAYVIDEDDDWRDDDEY